MRLKITYARFHNVGGTDILVETNGVIQQLQGLEGQDGGSYGIRAQTGGQCVAHTGTNPISESADATSFGYIA